MSVWTFRDSPAHLGDDSGYVHEMTRKTRLWQRLPNMFGCVAIGVDTRKHLQVAAVMDAVAGMLNTIRIPTDTSDFKRLLAWAESYTKDSDLLYLRYRFVWCAPGRRSSRLSAATDARQIGHPRGRKCRPSRISGHGHSHVEDGSWGGRDAPATQNCPMKQRSKTVPRP